MLGKIRFTSFHVSFLFAAVTGLWLFAWELDLNQKAQISFAPQTIPFLHYLPIFIFFLSAVFVLEAKNQNLHRQMHLSALENEEHFQLLFKSNPIPMWIFDIETLAFLSVNQAAVIHYGYSPEEFLTMTIKDIRPAEDAARLRQDVQERKLQPYVNHTWKHKKKDGALIDVEITTRPIEVEGRKAKLVLATDITEKRKAEADRYQSEQSFKALVENSPDVISRIGRDYRYLYINKAIEKTTGFKVEHYQGVRLDEMNIHPERWKEVKDKINRVFDLQQIETDVVVIETPTGTRHFQSIMVPELDMYGHTVSMLSTQRDITELVEARQTMEQANKDLEDIKFALDKAAIVSISDQKGAITYVNDEFCKLSQFTQEELIGDKHRMMRSDYHDQETYAELWNNLSNGRIWKGDLCNRKKDGTIFWLSSTIVPFLDAANTPYQYLSIQFDITSRKRAEENLIAANSELDTFVYRASHDIRGPLARLMGICSLGIMETQDANSLAYFKMLEQCSQKLNHILLRLLSINNIKHSEITPEVIDFHQLIADCIHLNNHQKDIQQFDFQINQVGTCELLSDRSLLGIVFQNILENSISFRKDKPEEKPFVHVTISTNADSSTNILITDNGIGITEEIKEKIFNIFFRGTEKSEGSGLGLYITKVAVDKLGGTIVLRHSSRQKTVFEINIPSYRKVTPYLAQVAVA